MLFKLTLLQQGSNAGRGNSTTKS